MFTGCGDVFRITVKSVDDIAVVGPQRRSQLAVTTTDMNYQAAFNPARIENILRRKKTSTSNTLYRWGELQLDLEKKQLLREGQAVPVTATEFALLSLLAQNRDRIFSRDDIMHELRGIDADIYSRAIDVLVSRLRQKLQQPGLIRTVRGQGYQLVQQ